ncbi:glycosyltransferase [Arthrobacter sp. TB 26]|uniref:glycosyltransferase n=1 Tax=Arthrobacter sp. TB 26 TaxID=494420 RepID=UPI0004030BD0|nr:glycosyltransferase [Arthrobacter sp. TB 26]
MKHPDEIAQISAIQLAKRRRYAENLDAIVSDYERLQRGEKLAARKAAALENELGAMRRARDGFKVRVAALQNENQELRSKLSALRRSKSLRLGRMITEPTSAAIGISSRLAKSLMPSPRSVSVEGSRLEPSTVQTSVPLPVQRRTQPEGDPQSGQLEQLAMLVSEFQRSPSKGALMKLISHEYFVHGAIASPAARVRENSELLTEASEADGQLIQNILGQDKLLASQPFLSPRQPNPGYLVEQDRVMYCAHSTGNYNTNGYATRTAGLVEGMGGRGEDVFVVARPGYPWDVKTDVSATEQRRFERSISGVPHIFNPGPSWTSDRLDYYMADAADIFVREAQRSRAGIIHAASNYVTAIPALTAARRLGIPFVYEVRGLWEITELSDKPWWAESDRYRLAVQLESWVAQEADEVFAITSQVRDELVSRGVEPAKISLLPNSVDTARFKPMPPKLSLRNKLGLSAETLVIGYTGSLVAYEGISDLLSATKLVTERGLDARLVVVGDGKQLSELKRMAVELGIGDRVVFTGRVPAKAVPDYVSLFDIMPCPRRRLPVTEMVSPLKPLESMASGKAVILSDLGPLRDLAGDGQERALLCTPGSPESLAEVLMRLGSDPDLRLALGRRARLWAVKERTWTLTGQTAAASYRRLRGRRPPVTGARVRDLKIGIIADQFTLESLSPEADFVVLRPATWKEQLQECPLDALFVESAWEGTEGLWHRKVGYYDDNEFATLKSLLAHCNANRIPTIFWNKEDPVHFNRFRVTAKHFDHVFTTDSGCIRKYVVNAGARLKTVASMPFYAQPQLHNILPSKRLYEHAVSYAGSYYGDKYPKRSAELSKLLTAAKPFGLAVYDRQHLNPDSPYHFPAGLDQCLRGGLTYTETVESYKAHPVHINVNSVDASPTMFSRRVMEIAASGGAVVSGTGEGVEQVLDGLVPVVQGEDEARWLMGEWMGHEETRARDAWLAYRLVYRGHTAAHRLAYALRTAGLAVLAPEPPTYAVFTDHPSAELMAALARQTVPPRYVFASPGASTSPAPAGVVEVTDLDDARRAAQTAGMQFLGTLQDGIEDRTVFEDLLTTANFGDWGSVGYSEDNLTVSGLGLAQHMISGFDLPRIEAVQEPTVPADLTLRRPLVRPPSQPMFENSSGIDPARQTVLIAGHDLKFASGLVYELRRTGHTVLFDRWLDHNKHDEEQSLSLLAQADTIFCEWTLGNAVWYARNKMPHQRLVTRVHSQEIFRPYLKDVEFSNVDQLVFVGQHIVDIAVRDHRVPAEKCVVISNAVDVEGLTQQKRADARFNLGFVGMVPAQKHLDKALDVLKLLRESDDRFTLFVKGKGPEDFPWMSGRPAEMKYYEVLRERISSDAALTGAVIFDPHGDDMTDWYAKIGVVLSTSDFESFHMTLADGAASGAVPVSLAWPGADQIYPTTWLHADTDAMARHIVEVCRDEKMWHVAASAARDFVADRFDRELCLPALAARVVGREGPGSVDSTSRKMGGS